MDKPAFSQEVIICPDQPIPPGWVVIDVETCAGCCTPDNDYRPVIRKVDTLAPETELTVCPQPMPDGWVIWTIKPVPVAAVSQGNWCISRSSKTDHPRYRIDCLPANASLGLGHY